MGEGAGNQEGESGLNKKWALLKEVAKSIGRKALRRQPSVNVQETPATKTQERISIPSDSGYEALVQEMDRGENTQLAVRWLSDLYPDLLSLLTEGIDNPDGSFSMKISEKWGFNMDQETKKRVIAALNSGNPKVIAILAFYLGEKASKSSLPLKREIEQKGVGRKGRENVGDGSRYLVKVMERQVNQNDGLFSVEDNRGRLKDIVAGIPKVYTDAFQESKQVHQIATPPPLQK